MGLSDFLQYTERYFSLINGVWKILSPTSIVWTQGVLGIKKLNLDVELAERKINAQLHELDEFRIHAY